MICLTPKPNQSFFVHQREKKKKKIDEKEFVIEK